MIKILLVKNETHFITNKNIQLGINYSGQIKIKNIIIFHDLGIYVTIIKYASHDTEITEAPCT